MAEQRTGHRGDGWTPWLGLGVVVAAVGCCAAGPLLAAGLVGAGLGGAVAGLTGAVVLAVCAAVAMVVVLRRRRLAPRAEPTLTPGASGMPRPPQPHSAEPDVADRGRS